MATADSHTRAPYRQRKKKPCFLRYVRVMRWPVCVYLSALLFWEYLGMSHHGSMFSLSSFGTLVFLLADLFPPREVLLLHSVLAGHRCTAGKHIVDPGNVGHRSKKVTGKLHAALK